MHKKPETTLLIIAYLAFIALGMYDGLLGVAWPSIRATFHLPLDALGMIFAVGTTGFTTMSFISGRLTARLTPGMFLLIASVLRIIGLLGFAFSPVWWGIVGAALFMGAGSGGIDSGLNAYIATHYSASRMNWLHACFGIGATLGPLVMTGLLNSGRSWRWGYAVIVTLQSIMLCLFIVTLKHWRNNTNTTDTETSPDETASNWATLRLPVVWLGIAIFFVYTGTELVAGQWSYTLFTEAREIEVGVAGVWVSIYWGSFTLGRILLGFIVDHVRPARLLRLMLLGTLGGAALIWWNPVNLTGFAGLTMMGFSLASIFPVLITETPKRLGPAHGSNAIGFQVGAAGLGAAVLPALAGVLADSIHLEIIGPYLVVAAVVMVILHEAILVVGKNHVVGDL